MKTGKPRFTIKSLFMAITVSAIGMVILPQIGMVTAHFEIVDNILEVDEDGLVNGRLLYRYSRVRSDMPTEYFDFACAISHLAQPELAKLKTGDKTKLRYRLYNVGPFKKQNVYNMFVTDFLGIDPEHVEGFVIMKGWTEIEVNGR